MRGRDLRLLYRTSPGTSHLPVQLCELCDTWHPSGSTPPPGTLTGPPVGVPSVQWNMETPIHDGAVELGERAEGRFHLRAAGRISECRPLLWGANNLDLGWEIPLAVAGPGESGYSRAQAEALALLLYPAVLGRHPDPGGFSPAVAEVQRGRVAHQTDAMLHSDELAQDRAALSPAQLLESYYRELLGREPDSAGVRRYLNEVARGRSGTALLDIVRSEEFEERLLREAR